MNICEEYAALLDMYADGFCTDEEAARVRRHLAECPACRAYVEEILLMRAGFPDAEETEVPEGFAEGVMAAIRAEAAPRKKRTMLWKRALLPVAACLTLVVALRLMPAFGGVGGAAAAPEAVYTADAAMNGAVAYDAMESTTAGGMGQQKSAPESEAVRDDVKPEAAVDVPAGAPMAPSADAKEVPGEAATRHAEVKLTRQQMNDLLGGFEGKEQDGAMVYRLTAAEFEAVLAKLPADAFVPAFDPAMEGTPGVLTVYPTE